MNYQKLFSHLGASLAVCLSLWGNSDWREADSPATASFASVVFGNDSFVAVGETIVHSSDTVEWHESVDSSDHILHQVIFAESQFVAVGRGANPYEPRLLTSTDGEHWNAALFAGNSGRHEQSPGDLTIDCLPRGSLDRGRRRRRYSALRGWCLLERDRRRH